MSYPEVVTRELRLTVDIDETEKGRNGNTGTKEVKLFFPDSPYPRIPDSIISCVLSTSRRLWFLNALLRGGES